MDTHVWAACIGANFDASSITWSGLIVKRPMCKPPRPSLDRCGELWYTVVNPKYDHTSPLTNLREAKDAQNPSRLYECLCSLSGGTDGGIRAEGEDGAWHSDAYAVETRKGRITLRYSLAWEYLGGRYNQIIQEQGLSLEELEQVLGGDSLRWLAVETLEMDDEDAIQTLDRECHVPRPATLPITLKAHIVSGRLQLSAPLCLASQDNSEPGPKIVTVARPSIALGDFGGRIWSDFITHLAFTRLRLMS